MSAAEKQGRLPELRVARLRQGFGGQAGLSCGEEARHMNEPSKAVFLSYASQDAEAARRICEALPPSLAELQRTRRPAQNRRTRHE